MNILLKLIKVFPPELSHTIALNSLKILYFLNLIHLFFPKPKTQKVSLFGMDLANKLGIAAGLDKNGDFIDPLGALGFGFIEVGTITPLAQKGNPKPRIFRIFNENAIINRLGFNNKGVDHLVQKLKKRKFSGVVGVNIGANKESTGQDRINDYLSCFRKVHEFCDYITVNISSPNTPNLRDLHQSDNLIDLLNAIEGEIKKVNFVKPIFLKISPDESRESLEFIIQAVDESGFSGLIATNTTINKDNLQNSNYKELTGGLSGKPLMNKATKTIIDIKNISPNIGVIGVGGVMSREDFHEKLNSGACLVQIYTSFIIHGPKIVNELLK
ncbi:quinone-dependent dihydroorotate dehydrogenase [Gammaproteobacteria bacterium]|nr:quinone-dependent dihydroorotate dehydrogenase [Gammaproteobacteria bacterium]